MDPIENQPDLCIAAGLDCTSCIRDSATSLARLCPTVASLGLKTLFGEMYPSPGCALMAPAFELAYREALGLSLRRPPATATAA